jgi:flagellar FliJ protein
MKRFEFKLERILHIKEHLETLAKQKYAVILQKKVSLEVEIREMEASIEQTINSLGGTAGASSLMMSDSYIRGLEMQIENNHAKINELEEELHARRAELDEAMKERKTMETLRDKSFENYKVEYRKHENSLTDEAANLAVLRKRGDE